MTETEWQESTDTNKMLIFLLARRRSCGPLVGKRFRRSDRKFRLYCCAWFRSFFDLITDERLRAAIETYEEYADGLAGEEEFRTAKRGVAATLRQATAENGLDCETSVQASAVLEVMSLKFLPGWEGKNPGVKWRLWPPDEAVENSRAGMAEYQRASLRDIFGNSFRHLAVNPTWLSWEGGTIPKLAQAIYKGRAFDTLPVLADALEEAGCTQQDILTHCRESGPHWRGCFVLDLLLGKS